MATFLTSGTISGFTFGVLIFLVAAFYATYYLVYLRQTERWKKSNIPFLQPTFLLGHKYFSNLPKYHAVVIFDQIYRENTDKDLIGVFVGVMPVILLQNTKLIREVTVKYFRETFASAFNIPESNVEAHHTIMPTSNVETWKVSRAALMQVFASSWFQGSRFEGIKETIHDLWHCAEKTESDGYPMNVTKVAENAVMSVITSNFGSDSHLHTIKNDLRTIVSTFFEPSFFHSMCILSNTFLPSLQNYELFQLFPRKVCNIMRQILNYQMNQRDEINNENRDFVDLLRSWKAEQESNISYSKDSDMLSIRKEIIMRQMTGFGLILLAAGSETINGLFRFAIHSLSLYPEYQRRIRREVHEALKKHGVSEFNYEVVRGLSFTFQCVFETSRLFPAGTILRRCLEDFEIEGTNYIFRKGDRIFIPLYSLCRDEALFPDPNSFVPERFASDNSSLNIPPSLLSFGSGPRRCPGYQHGMVACAALLASFLYKFEVKPRSHPKLIGATDCNPNAMTLCPRNDILVDLIRCKDLDDDV